MRNSILALSTTALLLAFAHVSTAETISVASELKRMRSADHLFQPQSHRLVQYSAFNRRGGNPDRLDCLYEEDGWRVAADHKGPGVVSRIWTTHDVSQIDSIQLGMGIPFRHQASSQRSICLCYLQVWQAIEGRGLSTTAAHTHLVTVWKAIVSPLIERSTEKTS